MQTVKHFTDFIQMQTMKHFIDHSLHADYEAIILT